MIEKVEVSVVIAVYNGEKYIAETLDSLANQTLTNWECWIVDDGSDDSTVLIVEDYCQRDNRFRLIKTEGGNGPYICANQAIPFCGGQFIARIDADDIALPDRLRFQAAAFRERPEINVCGSFYYYLHEDGKVSMKPFETSAVFLKWQLLFRNRLVHSTMMFRKSWFESIGMYPEKRLAQDWFLWVEAVRQNCLYVVPQPLIYWRIHPGSITRNETSNQVKHAAEVSRHAVHALTGHNAGAEVLAPIISALRGNVTNDPTLITKSLDELICIWKGFLIAHSPSKGDLGKIRKEFVYFGFYLLTINHRFLDKWYRAIYRLCRTEMCASTFRWFLIFFKRKFYQI